jgi:hypothetical protein
VSAKQYVEKQLKDINNVKNRYKGGLVWCPGQNKRIAPLSFLHGCRKRRGLMALTPEIGCNKTAMGLPPVTPAVFLIAN